MEVNTTTVLWYIFIIVFSIGTLVNIAGPEKIKASYRQWGLPANFRFLTGLLEAVAVLLVLADMELGGYITGMIVMAGAIVILGKNKDFKALPAPVIMLIVTAFLIYLN